jgi:hypothetical protein
MGMIAARRALCAAPALAQDKAVGVALLALGAGRRIRCTRPRSLGRPRSRKPPGGTIKMKIFPAQQLGKAFDHYNMARDGIADVAHVNPGYEPGRFPVMGAMELPFLCRQRQGRQRRARRVVSANTPAKEMADVNTASPSRTIRARSISQEEDRGAGRREGHEGAARQRHDRALHLDPRRHQLCRPPAPESRDVLEKGVAEAITFPWGSIVLFGIDKVTKYHHRRRVLRHRAGLGDQQGQIRGALRRAEEGGRRSLHAGMVREDRGCHGPTSKAGGRDKIKAQAGHELNALSPRRACRMAQGAEPLYAEWDENAKKAGYVRPRSRRT